MGVAVISQDLSSIQLETVEIRDCRMGYLAFESDPKFGPANIDIGSNSKISGTVEFDYLVDKESRLTVNSKLVGKPNDQKHLKQMIEETR